MWSPCNRFIAVALHDTTTIDVLDSITLQRLQTLEFPCGTFAERVVVFSPDSCVLTSSSVSFADSLRQEMDRQISIISWDLQTGGLVSVIEWQGPDQKLSLCPPIVYSANGKMVGAFYWWCDCDVDLLICDVSSGVYMHSHSLNVGRPLSNDIWTHGESLWFATADVATITIWEVGFTLGATPMAVETLPAPDGLRSNPAAVQLFPASCRLALVIGGEVLVWDARSSEYALHCTDASFYPRMTFSFDGCFFACSTTGSEIYLWKESPAGYILHKILAPSAKRSHPLLSQNGESIAAFGGRTIRVWRTGGHITPPSRILTQVPHHAEDFVLGFSPDEMLAAVAMQRDNTVTVLNLKSGVPQLTIDAIMEVYGVGVIGNSVVVIGDRKVITWNLPAGDCAPDARVGLEGSTRTMDLSSLWEGHVTNASVSPDSRHIALTLDNDIRDPHILSTSTGEYLEDDSTMAKTLWSGRKPSVRRMGGGVNWGLSAYAINPEDVPEGYPWGQPRDYQVTDDWWILGPHKKRLLMLPPPWQSAAARRVWNGRFLALLHNGLSEPVILELEP